MGAVFGVQDNVLNMTIPFKLNVERCSKFSGSKFKDNLAGAATAIRTRTAPANVKPKTPGSGFSKVNVIIWKEDLTNYKRKERI